MIGTILPDDIDPLIHEKVRLSIVSALAVSNELSFNELKANLGLTDGNLSSHSKVLEDAGYIKITKTFKGRKPHTTMKLTSKGSKAFNKYLTMLKQIVKSVDKK